MKQCLSASAVVEDLRLLANSMSTRKALADKIGISPQRLADILEGRRMPGPKVLEFMGLRRMVVYVEVKE